MAKQKSSGASHLTPKEEAGSRGGKAAAARLTAEERVARAKHASTCSRAKQKARTSYVMNAVADQDVYISQEEFYALK